MSDSEEGSVVSADQADLSNEEVDQSFENNQVESGEDNQAESGEDDSPVKKAPKRKMESDADDVEDEEDDEEDEDRSEDDEEVHKSKKKRIKRKRRRPTARDFIQDDVEVDDDDEEDDYEYQEDQDLFGTGKSKERRRNKYADMTEEEMERYFQERHAAQMTTHRGDVDDNVYDDITQNGLLPTTKDPNLWIVKCRMGEEKNLALQLMRKYFAYQFTEEPLQIKSVVVKEGLKGIIYIEAYKKSHRWWILLGRQRHSDSETWNYVRLKRTMYKDDLAKWSMSTLLKTESI
uniref:NGN domain-containing protein n=1 Tax=Ditylenchus dipsaci TaxID=166011 RepID=A0A915ETD3_9BILA